MHEFDETEQKLLLQIPHQIELIIINRINITKSLLLGCIELFNSFIWHKWVF